MVLRPLPYLTFCLSGALLAACQDPSPTRPPAPVQAGICWFTSSTGRFVPLDQEVANIETCAARLEVVYLQKGQPVTGAYEGSYVFIDAKTIARAGSAGPPLPLIGPDDRQRIDADIRRLQAAKDAEAKGP